ncbi:MAG: cell wall biosynthesis glycosyltransferase [Chloroflexi bacterium]|nr:MAG: cell wall biosynthesis glycosyltransferase [Chloroflexota bacterium]
MPKVSVVIPSYNHARFIGEAVESVLSQTEPDLELIVVDDGSTDGTLSVLERFTDPRLRVVPQEHRGAHAAINRGLREARGRYLAILNSDDVYHPRRLEKLIARLEEDPALGLVGSYIQVIDAEGKPLGVKRAYRTLEPWLLPEPGRSFRATDDARGALLTENYYATTSNFVFRRELYEELGGFRPLRYTHDWDFLLRSALVTRLEVLPEPLLRYRVHSRNTIRENFVRMVFEICWCLAVHIPEHTGDPSWFEREAPALRVDRLLHSIYTFGCDKVLAVMLLRRLQLGTDWAMSILEPDNPERQVYLDFISRCAGTGGQTSPGVDSFQCRMGAFLRKALRKLW